MATIPLTDEETQILKHYKRKAPEILVQAKAEAILLNAKGVDLEIIADFTEREPSTIKEWLRCWEKTRLASVVTGHSGNLNASKLTAEQRQETARVLALPPNAYGLPEGFWDVPKLAEWLTTRFSVVYESVSSYHFLLHFAGLSFHKPEPFDKRRDEAAITTRITQIRDEIKPLLADPNWLVFAADEVRIDQEADIRRAWIKRNTKTVVRVDRRRQAQSFIGFLNQQDGTCELERLEWQNAELVTRAVTDLTRRHPGKRIAIIWDNASWHKNKTIRAALQQGQPLEKVHLIAMPPYAPDHNPIEHVWKDAKDHTGNIQQEHFTQTIERFEAYIASRKFNYKL